MRSVGHYKNQQHMRQISALIRWTGYTLDHTWNSLPAFTTLENILRWSIAVIAIIILLVSWREKVLQKRIGAIERARQQQAQELAVRDAENSQSRLRDMFNNINH